MDADALAALALRAVELTVQGRDDPRLLVATRATVPGTAKAARLLAGLANAADGRRPLLVLGLDGTSPVGVLAPPVGWDAWLDEVRSRFPGVVPRVVIAEVDVDGALVAAVTVDDPGTLVVAPRADRVVIPWFDGALADAPPRMRPGRSPSTDSVPTARVHGAWIERLDVEAASPTGPTPWGGDVRSDGGSEPVVAWRGVVEAELDAVPGRVDDAACHATLLRQGEASPVSLEAQIHPADVDVGVSRVAGGIEIRTSTRVRIYLAAASREPVETDPPTVQLVVSLRLPGRSIPELRSLLLTADAAGHGRRWRF